MSAGLGKAAVAACALLAGAWLPAQDYSQVVGFLEDQGKPMVRVAFARQGEEWVSFCPPGAEINSPGDCRSKAIADSESWTAAFRGKHMGEIGSSPYQPQSYFEVGLYEAEARGRLPRAGSPSREFAGWRNKAVYRPLVLLRKPQYGDPEQWSPARATEADRKLLWPYFQKSVGKATGCQVAAGGEEATVEIRYQESDLQVVNMLSSRNGSRLIGAELRPGLNRCDGPRSAEWSTFWFHVGRDSQVTPLLVETRDTDSDRTLTFLDVGDYDGDGSSEAIFWISGYDEDGYVLYYDHFSKHVEFTWFYH